MVKRYRLTETTSNPKRRLQDIVGLLLFFLGSSTLVWLVWDQHQGLLPGPVEIALRLVAGEGAFIIPLIILFVGVMFLLGYERFTLSQSSYGSLLLLLVFLTWRHIAITADMGPRSLNAWTHPVVMHAGGYIGAAMASLCIGLLGTVATHLLLITLTCIGLVLVFNRPFVELLTHMHLGGKVGIRTAQKGLAVVKEHTLKRIPVKQSSTAIADPAPPRSEEDRRTMVVRKQALADGKHGLQDTPQSDSLPTMPEKRTAQYAIYAERNSDFVLPSLTLLKEAPPSGKRSQSDQNEKIRILEETLRQFDIGASVVEIAHGPTVTRYEVQLAPGIRVGKIVSLADNLAMSLAAIQVRVEAPIPGKSAIGIEVPNAQPSAVSLRECLDNDEFRNASSLLTIALGKDVAGVPLYADLAKMPHLLIGGATNSGKSMCISSLIASILFRATPKQVRFIMIDPKRVELSLWDGIPHLLHPVVKDVKNAAGLFRAALKEMDRRYVLLQNRQTRNIDNYNQLVDPNDRLPYIVIVVDELADLMMQAAAEIEASICRLAQLARATGIHLVIATQRPSVDVITGTIKTNIPSRIAFAVSSQVDSRTILDLGGAERLVGRGDMLYLPIDAPKPVRIQGCYLTEWETNALVKFLKEQEPPHYVMTPVESNTYSGGAVLGDAEDELFESAVRLVASNGQASTSMLQRKFKIGYTRAARLVDMMEERGIVGALDGARPRELLLTKEEVDAMFIHRDEED